MNHKHLYIIGVSILICLASSCKQGNVQNGMNDSAFVFETENIKGNEADYSRPVVITGHISHRKVYPNTTEISIEIPFYDRVSEKQTSAIYEDAFAFSFVPYAPRTISMPPYIDHLVVCPGDSIHVELDFADLAKVVCSGKGADNNEKLNAFHMGYYLPGDWPGFSRMETDAEGNLVRIHQHAQDFSEAARQKLAYHLSRLDDFFSDKRPSPELISLCRKEIEADYYSALIQGLLGYKNVQKEDVSPFFRVKDAEQLFSEDCISGNQFELSSNIATWIFSSLDRKDVLQLANDYPAQIHYLEKATKNDMLRQMLLTHF